MAEPDDTDLQPDADAPDDVRSALVAALEESEADTGQQERQPKVSPDTSPEATDKAPERARGPDGKFIRTEAEDAAEAARKPAEGADPKASPATTAKPAAAGTQQPATTPGSAKDAPANWTVADQQLFKGLPAPAQEFLLRRHNDMTADYTRKTQELAGFRNSYEPIAQLLAPHAEQMQREGMTPATLFQSWYNVEKRLLDGDGANVVAGLVQGYRIPVEAIARAIGIQQPQAASTQQGTGAPGQAGQPPPVAQPQVQLPPEVIQALSANSQWIQAEQHRQARAEAAALQERASRVMSDIDQFAAATDTAGASLHPHFRDVEEDMTRLVLAARARGGPIPSLSDIYDQAVWANPSTRAAMLANERAAQEAQRAADEQKRRTEARAKAEQSRRAGSSINGSPGSNSQVPGRQRGNGSVRDDIAAAMEDIEA